MENVRMRSTTLAVAMMLLLAACAGDEGSDIVLSQSQVDGITANAVNNNGWTDVDPAFWSSLAVDACDLGAWDHEVNATLTRDFLRIGEWTDRGESGHRLAVSLVQLPVRLHHHPQR